MGAATLRDVATIGLGLVAGSVLVVACLSNDNPHDDENSSFPLVGVHAAIPCENCHGDGAFTSLNPACESCHEADRPEGHYEGSCGEVGCHTPLGWKQTGGKTFGDDDDTTPGDDDDTTPGDDDDDTTPGDDDDDTTGDDDDDTTPGDDDDDTTPGDDHAHFPLVGVHDQNCLDCHTDLVNPTERIVCQDCHDDDRSNASHYAGQDCAHCHPMVAGWGDYDENDFTIPHPAVTPQPVNDKDCLVDPAPVPVELCADCHPDSSDRENTFTCTNCHEQAETDCRHTNGKFPGYVYNDLDCKVCHPDGKN